MSRHAQDDAPTAHAAEFHADECDDKFHDECGVFGILGHPDASVLTALGLHALQHRGQEAAGIVSFDGTSFNSERHMGLVGHNFSKKSGTLDRLPGYAAIGHTRYPTTGGTAMRNVQPLYADLPLGGLATCHNGNLTNAGILRRELEHQGSIFQSTSDTEVVLHLIATSKEARVADRMADALSQVVGAFSVVFLTQKKLVGVRDPNGVRPLVIGKLDTAHVLASETCALDIIGAEYVRDVEPGEMVIFELGKEIQSLRPFQAQPRRTCIFEFVYFSRSDSVFDDMSFYDVRKRIGVELAKEAPIEADVVIPVPDSSVPAALGYAESSGMPFDFGIFKNNYVGRTFIQPTDQSRHQAVRMKLSPNRVVVSGKRVILVDDSIVRGTTSLGIVHMVRQAGATEVHLRVASPPTIGSCFYGVDTPDKDELIASRMKLKELERYLKLDSLAYLSIDGLYRAMGHAQRHPTDPGYCDACFTRDYPIPMPDHDATDIPKQMSFLQQ